MDDDWDWKRAVNGDAAALERLRERGEDRCVTCGECGATPWWQDIDWRLGCAKCRAEGEANAA